MTASCRKRLRGAEDDCEDCMPISKRINGLHIRPEDQNLVTKDVLDDSVLDTGNLGLMSPLLVGRQQMTDASGCALCPLPDYPNCGVQLPPTTNSGCSSHPRLQTVGNRGLHSTMENGTCQRVSSPEIAQHNVNPYAVDLEKYEPEMDLTDNPHYYDINKLLFDAHLQRNHRRIGMPPS